MYIAVMGCGVVGSGVVELIEKNGKQIAAKTGADFVDVKYILDLRDFPDRPYADKVVHDVNIILNDPEVEIVVETMGGLTVAYNFVSKCLQAGKSVVTSNKELVAARGYDLLQLAKENSVSFLFEASVCGGIPAIHPLADCLGANEISEVAGILNGTTNFILTKMIRENMSFATALKQAQENGYAEADPTADVEGLDACRKICILASLAYGTHVSPVEVHTEGITKITLEDVEYAEDNDCVIKLLGRAKIVEDDKIFIMVSPALVKKTSPLSSVDDVFNALFVRGDAVGDVMFYGRGAGKFPTASAVVADVMDCIRLGKNTKIGYGWGPHADCRIADYKQMPTCLYIRGFAKDRKAAEVDLREGFGSIRILNRKDAPENEIAFLTPVMTEGELREILLNTKSFAEASVIRVTDY
ncbi:MAG: homoserine dehydrogenase [Clostridia bacterium]|nr:homoserine dehydrogenase [Clostridia bacterium]